MASNPVPSSFSRSPRRFLAPWIAGENFCWKFAWLIAAVLLLVNPASPALAYDYQQHQQHQYGQQQQYYQQQQQGAGGYRAVLLEDVKALTLRKGAMTTARRVAPVPQLSCLSGCDFQPDVVQCVNVGSDGVAVQWRCEAELPSHLQFGVTQVSCEGFDYPDDPRILYGSCGLQYSIVPVPGSQKKEKNKGWFKQQKKQHFQHHQYQQQPEREEGSWLGRLLTWAIITYIAVLALRSCCCGTSRPSGGRPASGQAGGYYPPPPSPPPPPPPGSDDFWGGPKGSTGFAATAPPPPQPVPTWASAATGFGLGYLFGRRRPTAPPHEQYQYQQRGYEGPRAPNPWPRTDSAGSSGSGRRGDDDTHTATAYASTSRR